MRSSPPRPPRSARYTLQHSSDPAAFVRAVRDRLEAGGTLVCLETFDAFAEPEGEQGPWQRFRSAVSAIHARVGSDDAFGRSLGRLLARGGFREVRVEVLVGGPPTVGVERFAALVHATAELGFGLFTDLFDRALLDEVRAWLADPAAVEREDPVMGTAIATGIRAQG